MGNFKTSLWVLLLWSHNFHSTVMLK